MADKTIADADGPATKKADEEARAKLSEAQLAAAKASGMTPEEYVIYQSPRPVLPARLAGPERRP